LKRYGKAYWCVWILLMSLSQAHAAPKSPPVTRGTLLAKYGSPCVDYSESFFDAKMRRRTVHTAIGYCYPQTASIKTLFVLDDGVVYFDFHYAKGQMTTADAKKLIDLNTPKT
jgi:hypothetical protein